MASDNIMSLNLHVHSLIILFTFLEDMVYGHDFCVLLNQLFIISYLGMKKMIILALFLRTIP